MASASSKKVIYAALGGNFLIALTKFIAFFVTQSSAMLSEGVHSVVDTSNQVLLLYGLRRAKKPADAQFPFGHGKEVYFWGFIVAIMIFTVEVPASLYTRAYITFCTPSPFKTPRSTMSYWHLLCFLKALPGILP
jgi:cation diffusion facilitator family transporter